MLTFLTSCSSFNRAPEIVPAITTALTAPVMIHLRTACRVASAIDLIDSPRWYAKNTVKVQYEFRIVVDEYLFFVPRTDFRWVRRGSASSASSPPTTAITVNKHKTTVNNAVRFLGSSIAARLRLQHVEPIPFTVIELAPKHCSLAEAPPAFTPTSTISTTYREYGGSRVPHADDGRPSARYAWVGWIRRSDVCTKSCLGMH